MARIQLRDTKIFIEDGLSGTAAVNETGLSGGETDIDIDTVATNSEVLNGTVYESQTQHVPVGARFTVAGETGSPIHTVTAINETVANITDNVTFTPALASAVADDAVITILAQQIEVKIGDGDLSWTENREMLYDLDRTKLDTVRVGDEQPLDVELNFVFESITTESGQAITPVDAIKRIGEATEWVNSDADPCAPYAVDLYVVHCIPCGSEQNQDIRLPDFRYESLDYSIADAAIAVSGRCNATDAITTRAASFPECS